MRRKVVSGTGIGFLVCIALLAMGTQACLAAAGAGAAKNLSFTAGTLLREFEAKFHAPIQHLEEEWATGRTTIYQGENEPFLYEDGAVIYDPLWSHPFPFGDGTALFRVDDPSQIGQRFPDGPFPIGPIIIPGPIIIVNPLEEGDQFPFRRPVPPMLPLDTVTFHSREHLYEGPTTISDTDEEVVAAPFVAAHWDLVDRADGLRISAFGRYALAHAELGASERFRELDRAHTFTYDEWPPRGGPDPEVDSMPMLPLLSDWIIYSNEDNLMYWGPNPAYPPTMDPRHSVSESRVSGLARTDLDLFLHEFALGIEFAYELTDRVHVGGLAGPVLGVADWDYEYTTQWSDEATGAPLGKWGYSKSDEDLLWGATVEGTVAVDLDSEGRLFVEAGAGYVWYEALDVVVGQAETELDLSSFVASLGVGIRL